MSDFDFRFGGIALLLRHLGEALTFAGILSFALVLRRLAGGLTFTSIDAHAVNFGLRGACRADGYAAEQKSRSRCERRAGTFAGSLHTRSPENMLDWL